MSTVELSTVDMVAVEGTRLAVREYGAGWPLLLVHGGGEDATMLDAQAQSLSEAGYRVLSYDRRGTGRSGRDAWPAGSADQHADDAAALLAARAGEPAVVVGVSSGAVIALALAVRHPDLVRRVVAWEPPAVGIIDGGAAMSAAFMAPVQTHLETSPGDYAGAQALLLSNVLGFPVPADHPDFAAARANAEPMIRDDPGVVLRPFAPADLDGIDVTVAVGSSPNEIVAAATDRFADLVRRPIVRVEGEHEVYLSDPAVLTSIVAGRLSPAEAVAVCSEQIRSIADGTLARFEQLTHPRAVNHEARSEPPQAREPGPRGFYATALWLRETYDALEFEVHDGVSSPDGLLVAVHCTMRGRQLAPFVTYDARGRVERAFPPTGRSFAASQTHWFRLAEGQVIEHWANRDDLGTAQQLGWMPPTPVFLMRMALATRRARRATT